MTRVAVVEVRCRTKRSVASRLASPFAVGDTAQGSSLVPGWSNVRISRLLSQKSYATTSRTPAKLRRNVELSAIALPTEVNARVSMNQAGNWLASQTRPDLAIQVSRNQQLLPHPTVRQVREANNLCRRAKQNTDLTISYFSVPVSDLRLMVHTDFSP